MKRLIKLIDFTAESFSEENFLRLRNMKQAKTDQGKGIKFE